MGQSTSKQRLGIFHHSVRNGNLEKVKELLTEGISLADSDDVFGTPLHEAITFDRLEVADLLIQYKADVNATQKHGGDTALCIASRKGFLPLVELLVKHGAKINQHGAGGSTPLHCALEGKHEAIAAYLVGASANVDILNEESMSPLHVACKKLCKEPITLILTGNSSLVAGQAPAPITVPSTLNLHDAHHMTPIMYVCQAGDVALVEFLLRSGAKTRYEYGHSSPLHVTKSLEVAKLLLYNGADVNSRDESHATPLHYACNDVNATSLVELFLAHHADLTPHDSARATPLHCAVRQGALANARLLLSHGANPNVIDGHKNTPLHLASKLGYMGIAELLNTYHADSNLLNSDGLTASQLAMYADD